MVRFIKRIFSCCISGEFFSAIFEVGVINTIAFLPFMVYSVTYYKVLDF